MGVPVNGRETKLALIDESTYNTIPGSPSGELIYVRSESVIGSTSRVTDPTMRGNLRGETRSVKNERNVAGQVPITLNAQSMCKLLKHLIGVPTTFRPAMNVAATSRYRNTTVSGVRILRANASCPVGAGGTLHFTSSGQTLTWTPPGGFVGSPVAVGDGGAFTLQSDDPNQELYVFVTATSLNDVDETDSNITVADAYEHVFTIGSDLVAGLILERDRGSKVDSGSRYLRRTGCRIGKGQFQSNATGIAEATFDVVGADFSESSSALDGTLDDYGHSGFSNLDLNLYLDGVIASGKHKSFQFNWDNDLDEDGRTIGGGGIRGQLEAGFAKLSGQLQSLFDSVSLLAKAKAETPIALLALYAKGNHTGTSGNETVGIEIPRALLEEKTESITGPKGTMLDMSFTPYSPATGEQDASVFVRTTRATV
jgi:hypothetical protein